MVGDNVEDNVGGNDDGNVEGGNVEGGNDEGNVEGGNEGDGEGNEGEGGDEESGEPMEGDNENTNAGGLKERVEGVDVMVMRCMMMMLSPTWHVVTFLYHLLGVMRSMRLILLLDVLQGKQNFKKLI
jgi:hypothetical protein